MPTRECQAGPGSCGGVWLHDGWGSGPYDIWAVGDHPEADMGLYDTGFILTSTGQIPDSGSRSESHWLPHLSQDYSKRSERTAAGCRKTQPSDLRLSRTRRVNTARIAIVSTTINTGTNQLSPTDSHGPQWIPLLS